MTAKQGGAGEPTSTTATHWFLRFANGKTQSCGSGDSGRLEAEREAGRISRNAARDQINRLSGPGSEWSRSCMPIQIRCVDITTYEPTRGPESVAKVVPIDFGLREIEDEARRSRSRGQRGSEAGCYG